MRLPTALEEVLSRAVSLLERERIAYMVIGGFALPAYGAIRATLDLDIAARIRTAKAFEAFIGRARESGFEPQIASFSSPVDVFMDSKAGLEVEFWLRPDGIDWDSELLRRRKRARIGRVDVWLVPPEDFIVSKLSRPDRGVQDEKDVKSILIRLGEAIDTAYLRRRARKAGVTALLQAVERA